MMLHKNYKFAILVRFYVLFRVQSDKPASCSVASCSLADLFAPFSMLADSFAPFRSQMTCSDAKTDYKSDIVIIITLNEI